MSLKYSKPTTSSRRFYVKAVDDEITVKKGGEKSLLMPYTGVPGRSGGRVSTRHKERGAKKMLRMVDFKREKLEVPARVATIEYDPGRSANIALVVYKDGEKRYIIAPQGLKVDSFVQNGPTAPATVGNFLPLLNIPLGTLIHNIELVPGKGGIMVRGAGTSAILMSADNGMVNIKLPSGEVRQVNGKCSATIGTVGNADHKNRTLGKAGRSRHLGIRPTVRGVAQHPNSHPHGGGEGRSGIGMPGPKTPWGKPALGKKTRVRKQTSRFIIKDRRID
ncbi:MAG: 50S ribosomal protein L2 [candidate division WWE3 bacterium]|nr:50S ribosomal protein L2 [candidate division WWE3 bacterium]